MKRFFIAVCFLFLVKTFFAQNTDSINFRKNAVYGELLGNMGLISLNYERKFHEHKYGFFTGRIAFLPNKGNYMFASNLMSVVLVNHVFFKRNNHFEIGAGVRLGANIYTNKLEWDRYNSVPTANFSYRYQKPTGRFIFRIGWTPLFYYPDYIATFVNWFMCGISVGFIF